MQPTRTKNAVFHARRDTLLGRLVLVTIFSLFPVLGMTGCVLKTIDTMDNKPLEQGIPQKQTRASESVTTADLADNVFIGIALSGGGSRAANFSAAVMLELEKLGILNKTTAVSSVSGSSLPAAYYGLYRGDKNRWNEDEVRKQLKKDFELRWLGRWFLPQNIALYWSTNYNRSDIMKEVLDSNLFDEKTFKDMGEGRPRILINATTLSEGRRFVFSEEQFKALNSRIDLFPIANAVMASSAFPGAFHDMTLKDFTVSDGNYQHVLDGGPSDNLGTTTLLDMVNELYRAKEKPKGCFLFVVDAYPYPKDPAYIHEADTRSWYDFLFDTNIAASSDALLTARRLDLLAQLNVDASEMNIDPYQPNAGNDEIWPGLYDDLRVECAVWHLSLQRLLSGNFGGMAESSKPDKEQSKLRENIQNVASIVNTVPTRYKLKGKDPASQDSLDADVLQDYLFKAANYLIYLDKGSDGKPILETVCSWFNQKGLNVCASTQYAQKAQ